MDIRAELSNLTAHQKISLAILALVAEGLDPIDAWKAVCGSERVEATITELYHELRGQA